MNPPSPPSPGFVIRHRKAIVFLALVLCLAGADAAWIMPAAVFPQTDFPRVVVLIDNGAMPADEMMATITRPVEEAMKDIPGSRDIRSATGRGAAEVNVFFAWSTDMVQAELYVLGRLSQIRPTLPPSATFDVQRLTFSAFPIVGVSLTSPTRGQTDLWEIAEYEIRPRFLRIPGVARVKIVGGRRPEVHVVVDPTRLAAYGLSIEDVNLALAETNRFLPAGMHEEERQLYLNVIDNRARDAGDLENIVVAWRAGSPVIVRDIATVRPGSAPQYNVVTADGSRAVLLNVYSQPDGNTLAIAAALHHELARIHDEMPGDLRLALFYDQSIFVREGVQSVWESIFVGLALSMLVLWLFLRGLGTTLLAGAVIPVTVLITLVGLRIAGHGFDLMTLGGIAAAIGLVIDDAIVMVEAIHTQHRSGAGGLQAVGLALREVGWPLVGSTFTPVVVFLPLAYLTGVPGTFFRALAITMVLALVTSLVLAVTWTPALASWLLRDPPAPGHPGGKDAGGGGSEPGGGGVAGPGGGGGSAGAGEVQGPVLEALITLYERLTRLALRHPIPSLLGLLAVAAGGLATYGRLPTDFLPEQDEGAFVLDYFTRPGTSLTETDRLLRHVEQILRDTPEVESFSRRTGARLALAIAEPNTGDFLVKLRPARSRSTAEVVDDLRDRITFAEPALHTEFPGVLADLIGDLTWSPNPVEIKLFSKDISLLRDTASRVASEIRGIPGVVDVNDGLVVAGPSRRFRVDPAAAARAGLTPRDIGRQLRTTLLGEAPTHILTGDRTRGVRVLLAPGAFPATHDLLTLPLRAGGGEIPMEDLAAVDRRPGILEMHRENLRQLVAVSARFSGIDMGHGIETIRRRLKTAVHLPAGIGVEFGGLYQQQQESFRNLTLVLLASALLVYAVLLLEFHSLLEPLAILLGALLSLSGVVFALWMTGTTLNIVSFLGAIIGVGIVAKNGILMMDSFDHLRAGGLPRREALVRSGRRRLRPVWMTALAAFLGLLPLAFGVGAGADMLRPLAIAVMGALVMSLVLSLIATPVFYDVLVRLFRAESGPTGGWERRETRTP